ncbi:MAG: hypothetical protein M3Y91_05640 [Actinomycetota bacterium]|nr:hypothetical protein [Actinomycetota bacterium]
MTSSSLGAASRPGAEGKRGPSASRGRNRRWLVLLMLTPVIMTILAVLAFTTKGPPEPSVTPRSVPAGFKAISDAYFGYAIPSAWKESQAFTDANGDFFYQGRSGWVGENVRIRAARPVPGTDVPPQLATFGQGQPVPYQLGGAQPVTVPGVAAAWAYEVHRPNGFSATAIEVWQGSSQTEMWLLINAGPGVAPVIAASLQG